jgi:HSP20 family molecular chaperone IbpA
LHLPCHVSALTRRLALAPQVKEEEGMKRVERSYGRFERRFKVPSNADAGAIKADMNHGVLEVHIPKREETKAKPVEISVGGAGQEAGGAGGQKAMEG